MAGDPRDPSFGESSVLERIPLVSQAINPQVWATVDHQYPMDLGRASLVFERDSDWFFLRMEAFRTEARESHLEVVFDDTENLNRKKGSVWDFVELRTAPAPMTAVAGVGGVRVGAQQQQQQQHS